MKILAKINIDNTFGGNYYEKDIIENWTTTDVVYDSGLIKPVWSGHAWIEGANEIEIIEHNRKFIPKTVSQRQLRTQLVLNGFDLNDIQTAINALTEPNKSIAQIAWDYAITFERDSPLLISLGESLGLSQTDIDNIFINASKL